MQRKKGEIIAFGYVKEEGGVYTAICVNMGLFGQGKTPEQALKKVLKAVGSYVAYVLEKHPDDCEKFLNRPAPADYVKEYERGLRGLEELMKPQVCRPKAPRRTFIPLRNFAQNVSFAQAQ